MPRHSNDAHNDDDEGSGRRDDGDCFQYLAFATALVFEIVGLIQFVIDEIHVTLLDGRLRLFRRCHGLVRLSRLSADEEERVYAVPNWKLQNIYYKLLG